MPFFRSISVRRAALVIALIALIFVILVVAGNFAVQQSVPGGVATFDNTLVAQIKATQAQRTATLSGSRPASATITTIAPFGRIDPAIIQALQGTPGAKPFAVLPSVQPVGVYLPGIAPVAVLPSATHTLTLQPMILTHTPTYTPTNTPLPSETASPTATATNTPTNTATNTPTASPTYPPTPTPFPTDINVNDVGIMQLQNLHMTPNPAVIGTNCAPHGLPVDGLLTQRFHQYHSGVDLAVPIGTPVLATQSGQVIFANWSVIGYGWLVIVQNEHYTTYYAHNSAFIVAQWQYVHAGDTLALSGSTGNSSGPHVHYESRIDDFPVDPLTFDLRNLATC